MQYHLDFAENIYGIIHLNIAALYEAIDANSDVAYISNPKADLATDQIATSTRLRTKHARLPMEQSSIHASTAELKHRISLSKEMQGAISVKSIE
jgi:hypothetical protein